MLPRRCIEPWCASCESLPPRLDFPEPCLREAKALMRNFGLSLTAGGLPAMNPYMHRQVRPFYMHKHGGMYADLDMEALRDLSPLLKVPMLKLGCGWLSMCLLNDARAPPRHVAIVNIPVSAHHFVLNLNCIWNPIL